MTIVRILQVISLCPDARLLESLRECNKLLEQVTGDSLNMNSHLSHSWLFSLLPKIKVLFNKV